MFFSTAGGKLSAEARCTHLAGVLESASSALFDDRRQVVNTLVSARITRRFLADPGPYLAGSSCVVLVILDIPDVYVIGVFLNALCHSVLGCWRSFH